MGDKTRGVGALAFVALATLLTGCGQALPPNTPLAPITPESTVSPASAVPQLECYRTLGPPPCPDPEGVFVVGSVTMRDLSVSVSPASPGVLGGTRPTYGNHDSIPGWSYRVRGASDTVLDEGDLDIPLSVAGDVGIDGTSEGPLGTFTLDIAGMSGRTALELLHDGSVVHTVTAGPTAPTVSSVTVTTDNGRLGATWEAADSDGDALEYTLLVRYPDGTGSVVAMGLTAPQFTPREVGHLPGGEGVRLVVVASDGLNVGWGVSDPVVLDDQPPYLYLFAQQDYIETDRSYAVLLDAEAWDTEDDDVADLSSTITWTSDLQGLLYTGSQLYLNGGTIIDGPDIQVGIHTITVSVTDSAGNTVESTFILDVT